MTRAQGKHREFSLNQSVATLYIETNVKQIIYLVSLDRRTIH